MTPFFEEKEISTVLQSFPSLQLDEDKRHEIASHIRRERELLVQMKKRKKYAKVIGGAVASFALLFIAYQWIPSEVTSSVPSAQQTNTGKSQSTNASEIIMPSGTVLTIDRKIQAYVDEALDKTNAAYNPENMSVVVTDPNTGEILAMGSRRKHEYNDGLAESVRAIPDPVVAFPIVTLAAAIEEGRYHDNEVYDSGTYEITPRQMIKDYNRGVGWGKITYLEGIQRSSNVAFAKLGYERLPKDSLGKYLKRFGFGAKTDTIFGEEAGQIPKMDTPYDVAMAATGHAGTATAIQQVAAIGAIANGGDLLKPHMSKKGKSDTKHDYKVRQVITKETAKRVREILESAISSAAGASKAFSIKEYIVAGQAGIAEKRDQQGSFIEGKYTYSFIGFAPSDDPKLLVYIAVDDPQTDLGVKLWGQEIVAPPFKEIMENSLQYIQQR
ncbi:cell division protein FtsK [Brevibacillus antibioticus]|uniref:Cell division protein FtsK n=1 Tax=Brevibacillus antibioticus TaxID=2570228 RepID=A0A4U2YBC9_9BACL|nr:penicillin-binding transpeptidase domain-containing protein [Brevibacillus antibioticus]TKI58068.1 cell division protein FtsK [Brevibacillus antibioticus]